MFVNTELHIAQCSGGCDIWFDTMMDEPIFPPHTVTTTVTFGPNDGHPAPTWGSWSYVKSHIHVCCHFWRAPRADVPESLDVNHICALRAEHDDRHLCSCGAVHP